MLLDEKVAKNRKERLLFYISFRVKTKKDYNHNYNYKIIFFTYNEVFNSLTVFKFVA